MNFKIPFILIILIPAVLISRGQVLEINVNNDGQIHISLTEEFINQKNVFYIEYEYSTKLPNQIIKPSRDSRTEEFNSEGRMTEQKSEKFIAGNRVKTHFKRFYKSDTLVCTLEKDHIGYIKTYFHYSGDTIFKSSYRAKHFDPEFTDTEQTLDSTFINKSHTLFLKDQIRHFNKNGLHVRTTKFNTDSLGLLKSEELTYTLNSQNVKKEYCYNSEGLVSELTLVNQNGKLNFKYFYDHMNVLDRIEEWKDGKNTLAIELVYDANGWLDAFIHQNPANNHIKITKLTYKTL